jgi:hypothetical protein
VIGDAGADGAELFAGRDAIVLRRARIGSKQYVVRIGRDPNEAVSHAAPDADRCLQRGEPTSPRPELTVATEIVELPQERDECVVGRLDGKVVDVASGEVGPVAHAPPDMEGGLSSQLLMEVCDCAGARGTGRMQADRP